ncbi:WD repeat-containing protein [Trifolium repens]|nr:WD repeat-containing protein [Trifolium repens]
MAPPKLTDYERKRLENIRRNNEMMAALKVQSKAAQLSNHTKVVTKSYTVKSEKKSKTQTPIVIRRSLRTRGIPPDSKGLDLDATSDSNSVTHNSPNKINDFVQTLGPIPMKDAYKGVDDSDRSFIESLIRMSDKEFSEEELNGHAKKKKIECSLELESLSLDPENIARVVPGRITQMRFCPSNDVKMAVAGNKFGDIGFWNVGQSEIFLYHPHQAPISGILFQPHCLSKIYTSCYDGLVRLMDAEKESFDMVYNSDACIYALSQPKNEANCLYFAEGSGGLTVWDNSPHIVATSSSDATACTWDLRCIGGTKLTALRTFTHKRSVQSAYFSPSGCSLATTSMDNTIGIYSGVNLEDQTSVYHDNQTGRWISTFRAIWGWDNSYLFIGNMKRGVDVVSTVQRATVKTLQSPHISAIPCRFDAHPHEVGMLAGATSGGQVYIWTSS